MMYPATNPRDTKESLFVVNLMSIKVNSDHDRINGFLTPHRLWTLLSLSNLDTVKKKEKREKPLDEVVREKWRWVFGGGGEEGTFSSKHQGRLFEARFKLIQNYGKFLFQFSPFSITPSNGSSKTPLHKKNLDG